MTDSSTPQKDLVTEARELLAKMPDGARIREAYLAPLLSESRLLLRQLSDEIERLRSRLETADLTIEGLLDRIGTREQP